MSLFDDIADVDQAVSAEFIDSLPLPDSDKKRYKKYAKDGLTYREFDALLEQSEYTPVIVTFDIQVNHRMSQAAIDSLLAQAQIDLQNGMMAKEVGILLMKGLAIAAKASASGII